MADVATDKKETKTVSTPEKKEVTACEKVCEKVVKDVVSEVAEKKASNGSTAEPKENGTSEKEVDADAENGDSSTDSIEFCLKRKSEGGSGDAPEKTTTEEGASPEKKAKLEENGEATVEDATKVA